MGLNLHSDLRKSNSVSIVKLKCTYSYQHFVINVFQNYTLDLKQLKYEVLMRQFLPYF